MDVKAEGNELQAVIVSLQYNSGPIVTVPGNQLSYQWSTDQNGTLRKLNQDLKIDSGKPDQEIQADFKADRNQTSIKIKQTNETNVDAIRQLQLEKTAASTSRKGTKETHLNSPS